MVTGPVFGQDPAQADWVGPRLTGGWEHITGTVPAGFAAYARILHPIEGDNRSARWSEVAQAAGTKIHAVAQWRRVAQRVRAQPTWWNDIDPEEGNLAAAPLAKLLSVLGSHTSTPLDCWFCLWNGYGWIHGSPSVSVVSFGDDGTATERDVPPAYPADWMTPESAVRLPGRDYLLGRGPLGSASGIGHQVSDDWFIPQSPNLFWPADRSWCVATEIDFDSTLVGGSSRLIDDVLATSDLEAWPIAPDDSLQFGADRINDQHGDR